MTSGVPGTGPWSRIRDLRDMIRPLKNELEKIKADLDKGAEKPLPPPALLAEMERANEASVSDDVEMEVLREQAARIADAM